MELLRTEIARSPWSDSVSDAFGALKADLERRGRRVEDFDLAIAAHAMAHEATLVTANVRHMNRAKGLVVEDWGT